MLSKISKPPKEFTLRARNPKRDLKIGGNRIVFSAVGGPAFCSDLDAGRRRGTFEELCNYMKIIQSLNIIHQEGGMAFETIELPSDTRHLDFYLAQFQLLDKNLYQILREYGAEKVFLKSKLTQKGGMIMNEIMKKKKKL